MPIRKEVYVIDEVIAPSTVPVSESINQTKPIDIGYFTIIFIFGVSASPAQRQEEIELL